MRVERHQGLGRANSNKVGTAEAVPSWSVLHLKRVADVVVPVVAIPLPVDRPDVAMILVNVPVPESVLRAVSVEVESLVEVVDVATAAAVTAFGFDLKKPVAAVVRVADAVAVVCGALPAVVNRKPVGKVVINVRSSAVAVLPDPGLACGGLLKEGQSLLGLVDHGGGCVVVNLLDQFDGVCAEIGVQLVVIGLHRRDGLSDSCGDS